MAAWITKIRTARRVDQNVLTQAFKLAATDIFQVLPIRIGGSRFIEIHRNLKALPYLLSNLAGDGHAVFNGDAFNRNKWNHIGRADARMRALMLGQVD